MFKLLSVSVFGVSNEVLKRVEYDVDMSRIFIGLKFCLVPDLLVICIEKGNKF